jgi:hypothetical protein
MHKFFPSDLNQQTWIEGKYVIYGGLTWSAIALVLYLSFNFLIPDRAHSPWFIVTINGLEEIGLLISGCLCLRNWWSEYISTSRKAWLLLAIAIFAFSIGNLWFCLWEIYWKLDPSASAGNPFFAIFYLVLIAGIRLVIIDRDLRLSHQQWLAVLGISALGLIISSSLTTFSARAEIPLRVNSIQSIVITQVESTATQRILSESGIVGANSPPTIPDRISLKPKQFQPKWVLRIDRLMQPLISSFNLFYIIADLVLLIFAAILYFGFQNISLGLPWQSIAQAVLCFYIADTWFAYANNRVQGYQSGFIIEVFWIFGIVQFGIAAALEFDNSIRAHRLDRRRTAIK